MLRNSRQEEDRTRVGFGGDPDTEDARFGIDDEDVLEWVNEELMNDNVADSDDNEDNSAFKAEDIFARYQQ